MKAYIIDLNTLKQGVFNYEYKLDDAFFKQLDQHEVLGGDVEAKLALSVFHGGYMLNISIKGDVKLTCDRCLDEMIQHVEGEEQLPLKLTRVEPEAEGEDYVAVDPDNGLLDTTWLIYELIEISLPIVHSHQRGECNPLMEELLQSHLCTNEEEIEE